MFPCNKGKLGFRNITVLFPKYNPITSGGLRANKTKRSPVYGYQRLMFRSASAEHCTAC
jgi:hypothetical protein